jgi:hypothetical protein
MPSAWWIQRVENVLVTGMPDLWIAPGNVWVELKAPPPKKRETSLLLGTAGLNVDQINWHLKARSMGVRTYVLVRAGHELFLVEGSDALKMNELSVAEGRTHRIEADWKQIKKELL